jgi:antitoxin component of RelBE/YafQ-DinJ toxin-antitoxin module
MVLKTFNVDEDTYKQFSELCKSCGMSMSKQIQMFMELTFRRY